MLLEKALQCSLRRGLFTKNFTIRSYAVSPFLSDGENERTHQQQIKTNKNRIQNKNSLARFD